MIIVSYGQSEVILVLGSRSQNFASNYQCDNRGLLFRLFCSSSHLHFDYKQPLGKQFTANAPPNPELSN